MSRKACYDSFLASDWPVGIAPAAALWQTSSAYVERIAAFGSERRYNVSGIACGAARRRRWHCPAYRLRIACNRRARADAAAAVARRGRNEPGLVFNRK